MSEQNSTATTWKPWLRIVVSLGVVFHLVGVMVGPLSVPPQFAGPPSILGSELQKVYRPYITALFLDHAYKFFAPNPGASHLMRYDLYFADGTKRVGGADDLFPDRFHHWPRLYYHRYFMLTEFLNDGRPPMAWGDELIPAVVAAPPNGPQGEAVPAERPRGAPYVQPYLQGFASYLARKHNAVRVDLIYRIHRLPEIEEALEGKPLDAPDTYLDRRVFSHTEPPRT